jgi:integrase
MPVYHRTGSSTKWHVRIFHKGEAHNWIVEGSKADAEQFEARKRLDLLTADPAQQRRAPSFCDFLTTEYKPHAKLAHKASWWTKEKYLIATLNRHFGDLKLTDIHAGEVERFSRSRVRDGLKASSVNNELRVLRRVLNYAGERGFLVSTSTWRPLPDRGGRRVTFWTEAQLGSLYHACLHGGTIHRPGKKDVKVEARPDLLPLVVFLANTGCRKGEALALTWEHVDLDRGLVCVWPSDEWQPKNGKPREIPIGSALRPWLEATPRRSGRWVFPTSHGRRKGQRFVYWPQRHFDEARAAAGLQGGPHTLRHSFAAHFLASCPDLYLLSQLLGHSHGRVTELYAHLLPDHLARARDAVSIAAPVGPAALEAARRWK